MSADVTRLLGERVRLLQENARYEAALQEIRDMDFRGNRHPSSDIARKALEQTAASGLVGKERTE